MLLKQFPSWTLISLCVRFIQMSMVFPPSQESGNYVILHMETTKSMSLYHVCKIDYWKCQSDSLWKWLSLISSLIFCDMHLGITGIYRCMYHLIELLSLFLHHVSITSSDWLPICHWSYVWRLYYVYYNLCYERSLLLESTESGKDYKPSLQSTNGKLVYCDNVLFLPRVPSKHV